MDQEGFKKRNKQKIPQKTTANLSVENSYLFKNSVAHCFSLVKRFLAFYIIDFSRKMYRFVYFLVESPVMPEGWNTWLLTPSTSEKCRW